MDSRKGGGKAFYAAAGKSNPPSKGKGTEGSGSKQAGQQLRQLGHDIADIRIDAGQEGGWEVVSKKPKGRAGAVSAKPWESSASAPKAWGHVDGSSWQGQVGASDGAGRNGGNNWRPGGRGYSKTQTSNRHQETSSKAPTAAVPLPPQTGWAKGGSSLFEPNTTVGRDDSLGGRHSDSDKVPQETDDSDDDDLPEDSDEDLSDAYDSDVSQKSHETRKKNKWFKNFFEDLDKLTAEEIKEQSRPWHCPACHNGPGAIDWYIGLQPLMAHAKTKGATRVKLHREFVELLDGELRRRGSSVVPGGELFGKWKGLRDATTDHDIVWPPMVIVMNTLLEQDDKEKWIGMGNQELLEYFNQYAAVKARHSYGPRGHRGISLLIFEGTAMGYLEAERLHKHFAGEGRDREAWQRHPQLFYPGGKRVLYGYLACKDDMNAFNQHCNSGSARVKFDIQSYQEMVVIPMKQMSEDNQQLTWYKNKVVKQEQRSRALEETFGVVSQKLRETIEENRIVRLRTKIQQEENKSEMDHQELFFKEQIAKVHKLTEEKERSYERLLQEERAKAKQFELNSGTHGDRRFRKEEMEKFIESQVKGVQEFEAEREKLIHAHQESKVELKHKFLAEEVKLEEEFDAALTKLMKKFTPSTFQALTSGGT